MGSKNAMQKFAGGAKSKESFLKYTLRKREARYWFIMPQDEDHWTHQDRQRRMTERLAVCAQQNGLKGVQVFHPSGAHLATISWTSTGGGSLLSITTEAGAKEYEEKIGDPSQDGRLTRAGEEKMRNMGPIKWQSPHNFGTDEQRARFARKWGGA